ncbi:MAG: glycosyltransferase family 4 protein [Kiritimatiellia bacterium]
MPWWDEARILRALPRSARLYPVHFIWGEFASPKSVAPYHRKGARVVVSVHCSARRWDSVWLRPDGFAQADEVILTSESQRPFVERHVPHERVRRIFLGVDIAFFRPPATRNPAGDKFRLLLMGNTERDHEFAAQIAAKLLADRFEWRIRTDSHEKSHYQDIPCVTLLPRLSDEDFLKEYQQADVLVMPMLDSAANDGILESMACGTPVMTNRTGGSPEYVASDCNFLMNNARNVDEWVEKLLELEKNREITEKMRPKTRLWAENFDWKLIAEQYRAMYREVLARG